MSAPVTFQTLHSTEILLNLSPQKQLFSVSFRSHSILKELCETLIATLIYRSVIFIKGPKFRALTSQISPLLCRGLFLSVSLLYVCFSIPDKKSFADHMKKNKIKKKEQLKLNCLEFPQWLGRNRWNKPFLHPS